MYDHVRLVMEGHHYTLFILSYFFGEKKKNKMKNKLGLVLSTREVKKGIHQRHHHHHLHHRHQEHQHMKPGKSSFCSASFVVVVSQETWMGRV